MADALNRSKQEEPIVKTGMQQIWNRIVALKIRGTPYKGGKIPTTFKEFRGTSAENRSNMLKKVRAIEHHRQPSLAG